MFFEPRWLPDLQMNLPEDILVPEVENPDDISPHRLTNLGLKPQKMFFWTVKELSPKYSNALVQLLFVSVRRLS